MTNGTEVTYSIELISPLNHSGDKPRKWNITTKFSDVARLRSQILVPILTEKISGLAISSLVVVIGDNRYKLFTRKILPACTADAVVQSK